VNKTGIKEVFNSGDIPSYIQWISDLYSTNTSFAFIVGIVSLFLFFYISINSHFGNFWIFLRGIKKTVAFIVKDRSPSSLLSNTNVLSILFLVLGILAVVFGIHGLFATLN
jgi:hypothetical protein